MRPVEKWTVGHTLPDGTIVAATYNPLQRANPLLHKNLDDFCNYCEVFNADLEVEHTVSQDQDETLKIRWTNFLLACGRCNGADNKGQKAVDFSRMYFPHLNNTLLAFVYDEGGLVKINPSLDTQNQKDKATALLELVCLDKYLGNPKYTTPDGKQKFLPTDTRWSHRRQAWETAIRKLSKYESGEISAESVAKFAHQRGFFSIWFTIFNAHREVREALFTIFKGTARSCFDADFKPIPRNPDSPIDPI